MTSREEYEKRCEENAKRNVQFLELFEADLKEKGLKDKTIYRHLANSKFYLNTYLTREDVYPMEEGPAHVYWFFDDFFIRKCMWSTPGTIKSTAASLKKFYKCMLEHGLIKQKSYDEMCSEMKEEMEEWCADCAQFNDPDQPSPFSFW